MGRFTVQLTIRDRWDEHLYRISYGKLRDRVYVMTLRMDSSD